jgi:RimJ/RimL family protein N-acetyltransferase
MIFLETERLLFRSHEAGDEAEFVKMHTDAEVRRYVGGQAWSEEKARSRFREQYLGKPTETYGLWATVFKEEEKYVGCCGLRAPGNGMGQALGTISLGLTGDAGWRRKRCGLSLRLRSDGWRWSG